MRRFAWGLGLAALLTTPAYAQTGAEPVTALSADDVAEAASATQPEASGDAIDAEGAGVPGPSGLDRHAGRVQSAAAFVLALRSDPVRTALPVCAVLLLPVVLLGVMRRRRSTRPKRKAVPAAGPGARRLRIRFAQGLMANGAAPAEVARRTRIARDALVTMARVGPRGMAGAAAAQAGARRRAIVRGGQARTVEAR